MNVQLFETIGQILSTQFGVDPQSIRPDTKLEQLGLDSLALMEFVFAVEDRFEARIPQDKLDPRQAGFTLERVVQILEDELATARAGEASSASTAA